MLTLCLGLWLSALRLSRKNLVLAILLLFSLPAFSQVELLPENTPVSIFGDGPRKIVTMWRNPTDSLVEVGVRFKLYQTSSATAAPLNDVFWKELQVLPRQTILESTSIRFPAVKAETRFIIQWITYSNRVLGKTDLLVYPRDLLSELKPLAGAFPVGVFDPQNILKPLLKRLSIEIIDLQEIGLDQFRGDLAILGPFESKTEMREGFLHYVERLARKGAAVVWLQPPTHDREPLRPSFCLLLEGRGAIVLAQSSLVANLSENPQSHLNLVQLSRLATHPEQFRLPELSAVR